MKKTILKNKQGEELSPMIIAESIVINNDSKTIIATKDYVDSKFRKIENTYITESFFFEQLGYNLEPFLSNINISLTNQIDEGEDYLPTQEAYIRFDDHHLNLGLQFQYGLKYQYQKPIDNCFVLNLGIDYDIIPKKSELPETATLWVWSIVDDILGEANDYKDIQYFNSLKIIDDYPYPYETTTFRDGHWFRYHRDISNDLIYYNGECYQEIEVWSLKENTDNYHETQLVRNWKGKEKYCIPGTNKVKEGIIVREIPGFSQGESKQPMIAPGNAMFGGRSAYITMNKYDAIMAHTDIVLPLFLLTQKIDDTNYIPDGAMMDTMCASSICYPINGIESDKVSYYRKQYLPFVYRGEYIEDSNGVYRPGWGEMPDCTLYYLNAEEFDGIGPYNIGKKLFNVLSPKFINNCEQQSHLFQMGGWSYNNQPLVRVSSGSKEIVEFDGFISLDTIQNRKCELEIDGSYYSRESFVEHNRYKILYCKELNTFFIEYYEDASPNASIESYMYPAGWDVVEPQVNYLNSSLIGPLIDGELDTDTDKVIPFYLVPPRFNVIYLDTTSGLMYEYFVHDCYMQDDPRRYGLKEHILSTNKKQQKIVTKYEYDAINHEKDVMYFITDKASIQFKSINEDKLGGTILIDPYYFKALWTGEDLTYADISLPYNIPDTIPYEIHQKILEFFEFDKLLENKMAEDERIPLFMITVHDIRDEYTSFLSYQNNDVICHLETLSLPYDCYVQQYNDPNEYENGYWVCDVKLLNP